MSAEFEQPRIVTASPELEKALSDFTQFERETIFLSISGRLLGRFEPFPDCEELPWVKMGISEDEYARTAKKTKLKDFWIKMGVK